MKKQIDKIYKDEKLFGITWSIIDAKCVDFRLTDDGEKVEKKPALSDFEFRFDIASEIKHDIKTLEVFLTITILLKAGEHVRKELGVLKSLTVFSILNLEEIVSHDGDNRLIPEQLFLLTFGVSLSTARGMLVVKTQDTNLSTAIVPLINPQILVEGVSVKS